MASRTWIGFLVGFKASNIWRIWNPKTHAVVQVQDVTFDESKPFNPYKPLGDKGLFQAVKMQPQHIYAPHRDEVEADIVKYNKEEIFAGDPEPP
jgi:hypothetical protein